MSKLDQNQRVTTDKNQNTFDLSHDYLFTATTGQLRPVSHDLLQAGDKVRCKFDFFVRTMPIATPAMVDVDFFVDYFFVPLELLWLPFGSVWSQTKSFPFYNEIDWSLHGDPGAPGRSLPTISAGLLTDAYFHDYPGTVASNINWQDKLHNSVYADFDMIRLISDLGFEGAIYDEAAGYVSMTIPSGGGQIQHDFPSFFPWQFCAYQCIYQHFYRDEEREQFDSNTYSIPADEWGGSLDFTNYARMRYLNRQDDYFTATKLSPLVSSLNSSTSPLGDFDVQLGNNSFYLIKDSELVDSNGLNSSRANVSNSGLEDIIDSNTDSRSVNQLRALFAQEKLLHMVNMTAKNYDAQVLARLGYDVPKDIKHQVQHLGHEVVTLDIQEIVSGSNTFNASTGVGSALGDLAGQGKAISRNFKGVNNFTAPCHGVLMSIFSCRTRPKYTASVLRKDLIKDITDMFTPELDDLGMQPMYRYETTLTNEYYVDFNEDGADATYRLMNPYVITGWNYRYEYLKRNINRASLAFMNSDDNIVLAGSSGTDFTHGFNSYQQWTRAINPLGPAFKQLSSGLLSAEDDYYTRPHYDLYKVSPHEMDSMMLLQWLESPAREINDDDVVVATENWLAFPWLMYQRDPFIIDGHFSCLKRSHMSVYSMPKLV